MSGATRLGMLLLGFGTLLIGVAYAGAVVAGGAPAWAPWLVAIGSSAASVSLFVLGAAARGRVTGGVAALLVALFVVLAGSFGAALALSATPRFDAVLVLGLPAPLAIVFYGVGFVPLFALPVAFGLTFARAPDGTTPADSDRDDPPDPPDDGVRRLP